MLGFVSLSAQDAHPSKSQEYRAAQANRLRKEGKASDVPIGNLPVSARGPTGFSNLTTKKDLGPFFRDPTGDQKITRQVLIA